MYDLTLITPTCDQPTGIKLAERWMAAQTFKGDIQWIVADDGEQAATLTMGQTHIRRDREPGTSGAKSLAGNLRAALAKAEGRYIAIIEHDDCYGPEWLSHVVAALEGGADVVGESLARYYHVGQRLWRTFSNGGKSASLCQTAFTKAMVPVMLKALDDCESRDHIGIDGAFWKLVQTGDCKAIVQPSTHVVGIKGLPGPKGLGVGHRPEGTAWKTDPDASKLREWLGDSAEAYEGFYAKPGPRIAIISQGPSSIEYPGREGYDVVIAVSGMATKYEADYWAFSDWQTYGKWLDQVKGTPKLAVRGSQVIRKAKHMQPVHRERFEAEPEVIDLDKLGLPKFPTNNTPWNRFSGPAALGLAWSLKPASIDCYGCDMQGTEDAHGGKGNRGEGRWKAERYIWTQMVERMKQDGIEVRHAAKVEGFKPAPIAAHPGPRLFKHRMPNGGWSSQTFTCRDEQTFRQLLKSWRGEKWAGEVEIQEVRK